MERDIPPNAAEELVRDGSATLVDVREADELESDGRLTEALHVPFSTFAQHAGELPADRPLVVICRSGSRSAFAVDALRASGREAYNVDGGMLAWERDGLPVERNT